MRSKITLAGALWVGLLSLSGWAQAQDEEPQFTEDFPIADCQFSSQGNNRYFPLDPGLQLFLSNEPCVKSSHGHQYIDRNGTNSSGRS